jgi:hypothetical protein
MYQNCGHQLAYCSSPAWTDMVTTMPAGDNSWLVHQSSLAALPAETSGASRSNERRSEIFAYHYLKHLKGFLTRRKILRHGTSGFTSHPKEGVLRILSPLKPTASVRFESATLGSSGKHTNHYTTEATYPLLLFLRLLFQFQLWISYAGMVQSSKRRRLALVHDSALS